ncbi:bifunctional aspartate kinase/homoserine dehydrogenase I [Buchnera aphidicola (Periphyllus koelreuteriae)]|uniref:bifunctional aspartate kinase/homoserine dehydrogenase I n=1 Tax=Buchnera aphidicola TaxID=9 RepID=UPI0031B8963E
MIKILKFGGTSLANSKRILSVSKIIEKKYKTNQIAVVLSAPAKITNYLEKLINFAIKQKNYKKIILKIQNKFIKISIKISKKNKKISLEKLLNVIEKEMFFLRKKTKKIYFLKKCSKITYAKIISKGEILSTYIINNILLSKNFNTYLINPVKKIIAQGNILESYVNLKSSIEKIQKINIPSKSIILMPGFIAGNKEKKLVLLGRNGSDYSAAILSACLKSKSCEIWTDVNGILTCDPKIISNAKVLNEITYKNILELSCLGAKVLHPKSIYPLKKFNIPCYIKNTFNKNFLGTKIYKKIKKKNKYNFSITYIDNIYMFNIKILNEKIKYKIQKKILKYIKKKYISIIYLSNLINSKLIYLYIEKKYIKYIKKIFKKNIEKSIYQSKILIKKKKKLSIISIVQPKIKKIKNLIKKIKNSLNHSNIKILNIQKKSKNCISFILKSKNKIVAIKLIHKIMLYKNKINEIFLLGIGGIGKTLLKQINKEKNNLKQKKINIKICLISNSNKLLFKEYGINLNLWKKKFKKVIKKYKKIKLIKKINKKIKKNFYINPIIIDCTSSKKISKQYIKYINNNFHVITANKKFNTGSMKNYKKIRNISSKKNKKFMYETNVGAGLPVIQTIKNIVHTGDKLILFKGILSGSLSYIFGKLDNGMLFSKAVKKAKKKGFTEPDPREDLSGLDVARKLLIIAREFGFNLELKDIKIEKILPKSLKNISLENFLIKIKKFDKYFLKKISLCKQNKKRIRFIGTINKHGKCKIKMSKINKKNPLYKIKNGENAFTFYTKYYQPIPLLIRGYGAGKKVTASGVFSDLLKSIL